MQVPAPLYAVAGGARLSATDYGQLGLIAGETGFSLRRTQRRGANGRGGQLRILKRHRKGIVMASKSQILANQRNSRLSSGPVTELGKRKSSQNARKRGLRGRGSRFCSRRGIDTKSGNGSG